jgi:hypothetical protein
MKIKYLVLAAGLISINAFAGASTGQGQGLSQAQACESAKVHAAGSMASRITRFDPCSCSEDSTANIYTCTTTAYYN